MLPRRLSVRRLALTLALVTGVAIAGSPAAASDLGVSKGFRKAVTVAGIRQHQAAFQSFSDANGGNRVAGSAGYVASQEYVVDRMEAAGYDVSLHEFQFLFNADRTPPIFRQESPSAVTYVDGVDFSSMTYSGSIAPTTASLWAVDLVLPQAPAAGATTSGCEAGDFAGMPAGSIALIQRGTCPFATKVDNATAAGAAASVVFNDGGGGTPDRVGPVSGTLTTPGHGPAIGTSLAIGQDLANGISSGPTGSVVTIKVDRVEEMRTTHNVIAETPDGDPNSVVVVGAHLDSVSRGPGINDNGSGSATILEIAETYAAQGRESRNKLRFMWYSAEEFGLLGSQAYVTSLSQAARDQIMAMVNFDMVGSPNYVRFVYDGDNSTFPVGPGAAAGPPGSAYLESLFVDYFNSVGLASDATPFSGRSDYGPFIAVGIPAGGLFTGAEGIKTAAQAATYGGTAGVQYDPCYHLACDTYANNNSAALEEMSDAAAHVILTLSRVKVDDFVTTSVAAARTSGSLVSEPTHSDTAESE
jgi:Zn-dependent M28 family amino/carboxypeptidase